MSIPQKIIEEIRNKSDIVEVISRYLPSMKKSGSNYVALCPFHKEKTPSFTVSREKGFFKCFGCGKSGDVFKFVEFYENVSWPESVKKLGEFVGIEVKDTYKDSDNTDENKLLYEAISLSAEHYHKTLFETYAGKNSLEYLKSRGFSLDTIKKFKVGFSQGDVAEVLLNAGIDKTILEKAGIIKVSNGDVYDYMTGRIVFPIKDARGRIVAFGGRSTDEFKQPKYLNSPETSIYSKGKILYGYSEGIESIRKTKEVIVVEGYMDVLMAHQYGLSNTVSCLGVALTENHVDILRKCVQKVALIFDSDEAGVRAAIRASENLINTDIQFFVVSLPFSEDPDEFLKAKGARLFIDYIRKNKRSFIDFYCDYLIKNYGVDSADKKLKIIKELFPNLRKIKSHIVLEDSLRTISEHLRVDINILRAEYRKQNNVVSDDSSIIKLDEISPLSCEETLIFLLIDSPKHSIKFTEEMFQDSRCLCVWKKIKENVLAGKPVDVSSIAKEIPQDLNSWFTALVMRDINLNPDECIDKIYSEMNISLLKRRQRELEPEVVKMLATGDINKAKLDEYYSLTRLIKGNTSNITQGLPSCPDTTN